MLGACSGRSVEASMSETTGASAGAGAGAGADSAGGDRGLSAFWSDVVLSTGDYERRPSKESSFVKPSQKAASQAERA
jgi:hypothetical protein